MPLFAPSSPHEVQPRFPSLPSSGIWSSFQPEGPCRGPSVCLKVSFPHYSMAPSFLSFESWLKYFLLGEAFPSPHVSLSLPVVSFTAGITPCNGFSTWLVTWLEAASPQWIASSRGQLVPSCLHPQHQAQHPAHSKCSINVLS